MNIKKEVMYTLLFLGMLGLSFSMVAYARENVGDNTTIVEVDLKPNSLNAIQSEREEFVEEIKEVLSQKEDISIDTAVEIAKEAAPQEEITESIENEIEDVKKEDPNTSEISLETNIPVETYQLSEDVSITFDNNLIIVDEYQESEEEDTPIMIEEDNLALNPLKFIDGLLFEKAYAAPKSKIKNASHTRHIYETTVKSWKLVTAYISSEFTYNGQKVTARRTGNYMKSNGIVGTLIKISNTDSAIQKPSNKRRIAYQSGTAKAGVTVKGIGVVWSTKYLRVNVESNQNGTINKSSVLR